MLWTLRKYRAPCLFAGIDSMYYIRKLTTRAIIYTKETTTLYIVCGDIIKSSACSCSRVLNLSLAAAIAADCSCVFFVCTPRLLQQPPPLMLLMLDGHGAVWIIWLWRCSPEYLMRFLRFPCERRRPHTDCGRLYIRRLQAKKNKGIYDMAL